MRVAPASSAFSTSSFTAAAGRSITSPAAMRLTVSGGRMRIAGMRRKSKNKSDTELHRVHTELHRERSL